MTKMLRAKRRSDGPTDPRLAELLQGTAAFDSLTSGDGSGEADNEDVGLVFGLSGSSSKVQAALAAKRAELKAMSDAFDGVGSAGAGAGAGAPSSPSRSRGVSPCVGVAPLVGNHYFNEVTRRSALSRTAAVIEQW